ncbi:MAG: DUF1080 domain-containing protein [Gemmataceae bacterium]
MVRSSKLAGFVMLFLLLVVPALGQKKGAITDPADADADFKIQGEYSGDLDGKKLGVQVIAKGNGKFQITGYPGGLPGDGFKGDEKEVVRADGVTKDGVTEFPKFLSGATIKDGAMTIGKASLKRVERQSPTAALKPPEGARILFDGKTNDFKPGKTTKDDLLEVGQRSATPISKDFTMHVEFRCPYQPTAGGQGRGNSGVYLGGQEVQVLDSFGLKLGKGDCGALYNFRIPDVNASLPPLTWQTYDIDYSFPKDGKPSIITVKHNGVVIHDKVEIKDKPKSLTINLQNHGNPVVFRNIWIVEK